MFNYKTYDESKVEYLDIAPASELPNGERLFIEVEGKSLVIFNIADQFFAIGDICSHDDGPVGDGDLEGYNVVCPRHGGELPASLGPHSPQRMLEPVAMVCALDVPIHLGAEKPPRVRVLRIAGHAYGASIFDADQHRTRVGAIVRTRAAHDAVRRRIENGGGCGCHRLYKVAHDDETGRSS